MKKVVLGRIVDVADGNAAVDAHWLAVATAYGKPMCPQTDAQSAAFERLATAGKVSRCTKPALLGCYELVK